MADYGGSGPQRVGLMQLDNKPRDLPAQRDTRKHGIRPQLRK